MFFSFQESGGFAVVHYQEPIPDKMQSKAGRFEDRQG